MEALGHYKSSMESTNVPIYLSTNVPINPLTVHTLQHVGQMQHYSGFSLLFVCVYQKTFPQNAIVQLLES